MKLPVFTNLTKNSGDKLSDSRVFKVKVDQESYNYKQILSQTPDNCVAGLYKDYAWIFWTVQKKELLSPLKNELGDKRAFSGKFTVENINLLSDQYWKQIGKTVIKRALRNEFYRNGGYFTDEGGKFCHPRKIKEKQNKKLICALDIKVYRNSKEDNFYLSLDTESRIQKDDDTPVSSPKAREIFQNERIPDPKERVARLRNFLDPVKNKHGEISLWLNNKQIKFGGFLRLPNQVNQYG